MCLMITYPVPDYPLDTLGTVSRVYVYHIPVPDYPLDTLVTLGTLGTVSRDYVYHISST
jgi:hypothetical protein